jgi:hypothetical protein
MILCGLAHIYNNVLSGSTYVAVIPLSHVQTGARNRIFVIFLGRLKAAPDASVTGVGGKRRIKVLNNEVFVKRR